MTQVELELPKAWIECRIGDVLNYGVTSKVEPREIPLDAWLLELEDVEKDTSRVLQRVTHAERRSKSTKNKFAAGDVLYGKLRPYLNKVVLAGEDGYCTTEIVPLSPPSGLDGRYLFYWLKHPRFLAYVTAASHGLNMPRLGTEAGRMAPFILAPLAEQKRIADKLDGLLARVDACRERLERVPGILKRFRQVVLASATSGELTREWRGGSDVDWAYERAEDVCEKVQSGGTPREGFSAAGVPFLKVYNIVDQRLDFEYKPQYIAHEIHNGSMRKSQAVPGDVLMNIVGPPLGKVAIVPGTHQSWNINQAIALFRPNGRVSSKWLYYVLCSGKNVAAIQHETRGTAGQTNISLSQCRSFVLPVPSAPEQAEIVRRVDLLLEFAESLDRRVLRAHEAVEQLTPCLLAKAFRGELVPHDPSDEPAPGLLGRIQAQVYADTASTKKRHQKGTGKRSQMKSSDKDKIRAVISKLKKDSFSFAELRSNVTGDYESTKDALFELLQEPDPLIRQVFDKKAKAMKIVRVKV